MHNRRARCFLFVVCIKAATLHHEVVDHTVKHSPVVVFVFDVLQKISHGFGRFVRVDLHHKIALAGTEFYFWGSLG